MNPIKTVRHKVNRIANAGWIPILTINVAQNIFTMDITDPTDKSIPDVMITNVIPTDDIPNIATCLVTFQRFSGLKNEFVINEKNIINTKSTITIPYCFKYTNLLDIIFFLYFFIYSKAYNIIH